MVRADDIKALTTAVNATFARGYAEIATKNPRVDDFKKIAMVIPSTGAAEDYPFVESDGQIREWIGDREVHRLKSHGYNIKNKDFEKTLAVKANDIADNKLATYMLPYLQMGAEVREFPNRLLFGLLAKGNTTTCYDGQNFFDTEHSVMQGDKKVVYSNIDEGAEPVWYLLDSTKFIAPLIYQVREEFKFVAKDKLTDDNVFDKKEFVYGVDGRANAGFGLWQLAHRSTLPLTAENFAKARVAMSKIKGSNGQSMGVRGSLLLTSMDNEANALKLIKRGTEAGGADNIYQGVVDLMISDYI